MKTHNLWSWPPLEWIVGGFLLLGLYLVSRSSYLLFHSLVEIGSIIVACGVFMIAWNSRHITKNAYIEFLGIAYLFVAILDLLHTLTYKGMGIFPDHSNLSTQFWIAARYLESCSLLVSFLFLRRTFNPILMMFGYFSSITIIILAGFWGGLPDCFLDGIGLTRFKRLSEYLICILLLTVIFALIKRRQAFENSVWRLFLASIVIKIPAELTFTLYTDVYGLSNLVGHFLKLLSFYLLYRAIIATSLKRPYDVLFQHVKQSEQSLRLAMNAQEQRAFEFEQLNRMNNALQTCHTESETYPVLTETCQRILPGSTGVLCLLKESQLSVAAYWGDVTPAHPAFEITECVALQHYSPANSLIFFCHTLPCTRVTFSQNSYQNCVVLKSPQGILGILHLSCRSSQHGDIHDRETIVIRIAEQYALSLANLRLLEQLKIEAIRDPLTGLYNRRYMQVSLKREWARAERHNHSVTIIMLDLDHFKAFNDTYGHDAGDIVLKEIGALLQRHVRTEDIACRYGGEEFLLILPEVNLEVAKYRAEELRILTHELGITYQRSLLSVTISIGVAVFPHHGHDLDQVIRAADAALYQAKKEGRDRVVAAHSSLEISQPNPNSVPHITYL